MRYRREACVTSAGGLGLFFLCSCAKFGEFDSSSESPKRCNSVFKESSQWPPAVLKLIPTSIEEKRNTILCHSIGKTNRKPLIFKKKYHGYCYSPECSATGMGRFPIYKLKWDLLRTSITACTIDKNTFSAPFEIFYVRTEILKEIFQKKSYTSP